jgi:hypothetical protein
MVAVDSKGASTKCRRRYIVTAKSVACTTLLAVTIYVYVICYMAVGVYDLLLQNRVLYDFMFLYIRMSPYTNAVQTP